MVQAQNTVMSQPQQVHSHSILNVEMRLMINGENFTMAALVDTGAEVNLIRKGLIPARLLRKPPTQINSPQPIPLPCQEETLVSWG